MAAFVRIIGSTTRHCNCHIPFRITPSHLHASRRHLASTAIRKNEISKVDTRVSPKHFAATLSPHDRAIYDSLSPAEKHEFQVDVEEFQAELDSPAVQASLNATISQAANELEPQLPQPPVQVERIPAGFLAMSEDDAIGTGPDDEFADDDMSSAGHAELERHREIREYARIAAWEMPLLSKLAKPFIPPDKHKPLRFRYTTYMGETHPAEKKIALELCVQDMPDLTDLQRDKLIKLVGVRYNPETEIVKMSCDMFETQAQNKRYLGDLVDSLLREAKDPTDTFADIPFDFRHHQIRVKHKFPPEWNMTPERKDYLERSRHEERLLEQQQVNRANMIDGVAEIEKAYANMRVTSARQLPVPERTKTGKRAKIPKGKMRLG